jgi:hypothetical protein
VSLVGRRRYRNAVNSPLKVLDVCAEGLGDPVRDAWFGLDGLPDRHPCKLDAAS